MVRLLPEQAKSLDAWRAKQTDRPGRPEAIRRLIERAFTAAAPSGGDQTATVEERAHRKHRLIKGPREFRDVRGDQPKKKG
jgi:hypothetical protein